MNARPTRREFLTVASAGTLAILASNVLGCEPAKRARETRAPQTSSSARNDRTQPRSRQQENIRSFRSRPDLKPPTVGVRTRAREVAPGYVFVAPKLGPGQDGPMILDNRGEPVWFYPVQDKFRADNYATDFKVQSYRSEPVLTWWEGRRASHHGTGGYVILDSSYREVGRIPAADGYDRDLHEFNITPQDTALITFYELVSMDLSSLGGRKNDVMYGGGVEEVDIETGEVMFRWRSLDHVGLEESYRQLNTRPYDYFHINTIEVDHDGNLLICARNTWAVYKVDRTSGEVIWRLGGKESDFEMGPGTEIAYQHDARRHPDGTITIFDNGAAPRVHKQSRGIVLEVDEDEMRASLVREYTHPDRIVSEHQGNMQVLPNGNVFIGWGHQPIFSEFDSDGELLFDAAILGTAESYRAFRFEWSGKPEGAPRVAVERVSGERMTAYASWNGATEVATWQVLAGPGPDDLKPVASVPRKGFETAISVRAAGSYLAVKARDGAGRVLGTSEAVET